MDCPLREPNLTFRKYQKDAIEQVNLKDDKILIVAPPGSGKTIIGLELIRRGGVPAVVFAPTTIIARQWKEKLNFFCDNPDVVSSLEPDQSKFINIFTYQRISTRSEADDAMLKIAEGLWQKDLQKTLSEEDSLAEIERIKIKNKDFFRKRILAYAGRLRREYDRSLVEKGLHKNALALIEQLKTAGVKIIILDECHHLLEYWGLVITYLKDVLGATVIGLTATYPIAEEQDVFFDLLHEIDYDVSTPAVVKEGFLAPYRELAYFVTPTQEEIDLINSEMLRINKSYSFLITHPKFPEFLKWGAEGDLFKENYPLYELIARKDQDFNAIDYDSKLILIKGFLDHIYPLLDEESRNSIFHTLKSSGINYTNRSLYISRTIEKYSLSYSESRIQGAIEILKKESEWQKDKLRAIALADFDMFVPSKTLKPGKVMGSATFFFIRLIKELDHLDPILVTGNRVYCDDDTAEKVIDEIHKIAKARKLDISIKLEVKSGYSILQGSGKDWRPSNYTLIITELFAHGITKLLVGTKALFGEGWDSLKLNTMVDLTAISFGTSVQQIRGRAIRLDPEDQTKVAHNWDIVCIYPNMFSQLSKLSKKHRLVYGIDDTGNICKRTAHLDKKINAFRNHIRSDPSFYSALSEINQRMLDRAKDRQKTLTLWGVGTIYEDRETSAVSTIIKKKIIPVQTLGWFYNAFKLFLFLSGASFIVMGLSGSITTCCVAIVLWLIFTIIVSTAAYTHLLRNPVAEDKVVAGMAKAVYSTLKRLNITDDSAILKLTPITDESVEVALYGKGSQEFALAMNELLSRPLNPRYILLYDVAQPVQFLPIIYQLFSLVADNLGIQKRYFAVPTLFAANKKNMELFAQDWSIFVGGGKFIYTRSEEGAALLKQIVFSGVHDWVADVSDRIYWNYFGTETQKQSRTIF